MHYKTLISNRFLRQLIEAPFLFWTMCILTGILIYFSSNSIFRFNRTDFSDESFFSVNALGLVFSFIPAYILVILSLMPKNISKHLSEFRGVINLPDVEFESLQRKVLSPVILKRNLWLLTILIFSGNILILIYYKQLPQNILYVYFLLITILSLLILYTISKVSFHIFRLQNLPLIINILDTTPLLSLSRLTQKLALYITPITTFFGLFGVNIALVYINQPYNPDLLEISIGMPVILLGPSLIVLSAFIFIMPVLWVRRVIIERKQQALSDIAKMLLSAFNEHDNCINTGNLSNINALTASINALSARAEIYKKISELPWEAPVLRELLGAIVLPIILWIAQFYLGRILGN